MKTWMGATLALLWGAMLFAVAAPASAAEQDEGGAPPAEAKPDTAKPDADKAGAPAEDGGAPSGEASGTASLKDLVSDGFVIRTTVFIPADAVTRQLGKVASDAIVLTLQKQTSTAVCYYTFKAYVGEGLTAIPSCVVHR